MSDTNWVRARNEKQIEQRIDAILGAAAEVFSSTPYEKVTMLMIARKAGSSRSNLYRYFRTREEIFLSLYLRDLNTWVGKLPALFTGPLSPEEFVKKWTAVLYKQKRLLELSPLLSISLERNTSEEVLKKTKLEFHNQMARVVPSIQKALPKLSSPGVMDFFITHQALVAGGWPMAQYTELQRKVIGELKLSESVFDFKKFYSNTILFYLKGALSAK